MTADKPIEEPAPGVFDAVPRGPLGKVDRRALPSPESEPRSERLRVPPRTPLEEWLAEVWAENLGLEVDSVGVEDDFFALGGHSLLAVQLLSRVRESHGADLTLEIVYSGNFTVAELAKAIERKQLAESNPEYEDLLRELEGLTDEEARALLAAEQDVG